VDNRQLHHVAINQHEHLPDASDDLELLDALAAQARSLDALQPWQTKMHDTRLAAVGAPNEDVRAQACYSLHLSTQITEVEAL